MKPKLIEKTDKIANAIKKNPAVGRLLFEEGLGCSCCPIAMDETLEEGCAIHGLDVKSVLAKLNKPNKRKKR